MKKAFFTLLILWCVLPLRLFSLDLELKGGLGNLAFNPASTTALSDPDNPGDFSPHFFPLISARLSGEFKILAYNAGYERDPVLRNRLFANLRAGTDYFFVEAGPIIGLFNTAKLPVNPGISASLGFGAPGIIFARASGSSTLGTVMDIIGNYSQTTGDISVEFWVPYVICSLNMSTRNFTLRENATLLIEDELTRYFFSADVYAKNMPFTVRVNLGFQDLKRTYDSRKIENNTIAKDTQTDEHKSVFAGLEAKYTISPALKILLGGEMPIYSWSVRPLKDPSKGILFFRATAGFILTFPNL